MDLLGQTLEEKACTLMDTLMNEKTVVTYAMAHTPEKLEALEQMFAIVTQSIQWGNLRRGVKHYGAMERLKDELEQQEENALGYFTSQLLPNQKK